MEMLRRERAKKKALLKQRSGGLLARELKALGVTFDCSGSPVMPMK
jgi:hypothetical protein